jgi:signal transduction histidine kinase
VALLGYTKYELKAMRLKDILHTNDLISDPIKYEPTGKSSVRQRRMRKKDGSLLMAELRSQQLADGVFLLVARDLTDRLQTQQKLRDSYKSVRRLTAHLQNIREEERAGIAREIHDVLGQQLTVMKMDVSWLNRKIETEDPGIKSRIGNMLQSLNEIVKTIRRISSELRPSILDDLGLVPAMEWHLKEFENRSGIRSTLHTDTITHNLNNAAKTALFRILQESLTNVAKHSQATEIVIRLEENADDVKLTIEDNGAGFEPENIKEKRTLGLLGMNERASMIGGRYEIQSSPGKGTVVRVSIPVKLNVN